MHENLHGCIIILVVFRYSFIVLRKTLPFCRSADAKESPDPAQAFLPARKSQDAAVGMLVHMLRTAPPLRQDRSYYSQASRSEFDGGDPNDIGASGFLVSRKASDALEELRSYKAMKDLLLSQSRIQPSDH